MGNVMAPKRKLTREEIREQSKLTKEEWRDFTKTVWHVANTSDPEHPAVFAPEIPRRLIKMFSFVGDTVLDPFAGVGTTAKVANELERNCVCVEQNEHFAKRITKDVGLVANHCWTEVVAGDSRDLGFIGDSSIQLIVTSPPYWNKADYGDGEANIGSVDGYRDFLAEIAPVWLECLRVLEPGRKLCIVTANVSQHTEHGLLMFPLAADFIVQLRDLGFLVVGEAIWSKDKTGGKWGSSGAQRPIFGSYPYPPNFLFKTLHEHVLVFAKPPTKVTKGPKVKRYGDLMGQSEVG
jgi:DNA modification methylase